MYIFFLVKNRISFNLPFWGFFFILKENTLKIMAGHSQFKNIMHRKGAQDKKRAKVFTKMLREITVAVQSGGIDLNSNARLRLALAQARSVNMPKATIERAMNKINDAQDKGETLFYEAFGPGNVAMIIEVLTDNRNRSACEVRSCINKGGGYMGDVKFLFDYVGMITYGVETQEKKDDFLLKALEFPVLDIQDEDMPETYGEEKDQTLNKDHLYFSLFVEKEDFMSIQESLSNENLGTPIFSSLIWKPKDFLEASEDTWQSLSKLTETLQDLDDVQEIFTNLETPCVFL